RRDRGEEVDRAYLCVCRPGCRHTGGVRRPDRRVRPDVAGPPRRARSPSADHGPRHDGADRPRDAESCREAAARPPGAGGRMNSLRAHRIAEATAAIHEVERSLVTHRTAAPGMDSTPAQRSAWLARDRALRAELVRLQAERMHLIGEAEAEAGTSY